MRGAWGALYLIALGWYIRYSGLDVQCARIAREGWENMVRHTARVTAAEYDTLAADKTLEFERWEHEQ